MTNGAVSGGVDRHRQSSLLNCQAVVEVDPIQATHKEWQALIDRAGTSGALACAAWFSPIAQERAGCWTFRNGSTKSSVSGSYRASWHEAETAERAGHTTGAGGDGWSAPSFRISTADGWLEVDGIARTPFGIDRRASDGTGNRSWFLTHLPSGPAVVSRVRTLAAALALTDRIAALTDWDAHDIDATPELRERVREALNRANGDFFANRLPALPEDALPAA